MGYSMRLLRITDGGNKPEEISGFDHDRYSQGRLNEVSKLQELPEESVQRIEKLLTKLLNRLKISGVSFYISGLQDIQIADAGKVNLKNPLSELDELALFSGNPVQDKNQYLLPVESQEFVIGYLFIQISSNNFSDFVQEVLATYVELISHELELATQKSTLENVSERLQKKKKELEKIQEYNNYLLSITTHDLSSPLNAVSGYIDLMYEGFQNDSQTNRIENYHQRIQSGLQDVMGILKQLSEVSRIERGTVELDMFDVNLSWVVRKVCKLLESNAIEKEIKFCLDVTKHQVYVKADIVKLKRVIHNLVSNAIKYTDSGGTVKVQVDRTPDTAILKVKDNGVGIPESHYSKIFAPFIKLEKSDDFSSNGLGLYVASYFTDLMNGEITVESQEKKGSIFTVSLPRVKPVTDGMD